MQDKNMRDYSLLRLEKSADDLDTARINYKSEKYDAAANRAYYSVFHAIRAVLALDNIERKKHSGNISYFREHYLATGIFDRVYSDVIKKAELLRNAADYDDELTTSADEANEVINKAQGFCDAVKLYIEKRLKSE
ncbi:MAG: HEPN domain-containing protein [Oscillospiraceae bacterium]|nr:HEPN domain-containing protein [Oscillospiraceae bacterium]